MGLAQIGPFTSTVEAVATAMGAGVIVGSVAMGVVGMALGWPREEIAGRAITDGYVGGLFGATLVALDAFLRYGF